MCIIRDRGEKVMVVRTGNGVSKDGSKTHSKECTGLAAYCAETRLSEVSGSWRKSGGIKGLVSLASTLVSRC